MADENNNSKLKDYGKNMVDAADIMTSIQGLIYKQITSGGEAGIESENNFFAWQTPGIPMMKEDLEFVSQGFRGMRLDRVSIENATYSTRAEMVLLNAAKRAAQATEEKKNELKVEDKTEEEKKDDISPAFLNIQLSDDEIEDIRAQKTFNLYMQAESFARLVDIIPDVSNWKKEDAKLVITQNNGCLSDVYKETLIMSQVMDMKLDEETKKLVEQYRAALDEVVKTPPILPGMPEEEVTQPTRLKKMYIEKMNAYNSALLALKTAQMAALSGNAGDIHRWTMTGQLLKNAVDAAYADWQTSGYKNQYERIAAYIEQVESRSMVTMKEEYKKILRNAYVTGVLGGQEFLFTTLSPMNFAEAGSWLQMSFSKKDYNSTNDMAASSSGVHVNAQARIGMAKAGGHYDSENQDSDSHYTFDLSNFIMEFEICQVEIVRPWFKPSFLNSRFWRFTPGNKDKNGEIFEMLSDGEDVPKGKMPAYPTSILFVRNLVLDFKSTKEAENYENHVKEKSHGANVSFGGLLVSGRAGYEAHNDSSSSHSDYGYHREGSRIKIDGMQIIGYRCHLLGKSPNPLPSITEWV